MKVLSDTLVLDKCRELGNKGWRPYHLQTVNGRVVECISWPYPERESIRILVREPNDPTSMVEHVLVGSVLDTVAREIDARR